MVRKIAAAGVLACIVPSLACAQEFSMPGGIAGPSMSFDGSVSPFNGSNSRSARKLYRFERQEPWLHGFHQMTPAYGGYNAFRPYNYKHVLSQTAHAGRTGAPRGLPYSQHFWNKYQSRPTTHGPATVASRPVIERAEPVVLYRPPAPDVRHAHGTGNAPNAGAVRRSIATRPLFPLPK